MGVSLRRKLRADGSLKGYAAVFYDADRRPKRKERALGTRDKQAARSKLTKLERAWAAGDFDPWAERPKEEGVTVASAVGRFLENRAHHCSPSTLATYGSILNPFARQLAPAFPLYGVEPRHVEAYLALPTPKGTPRSPATTKNHADRLRIFFAWCVEERLVERSPMPERRRARSQQDRREEEIPFLSVDDFARLVTCIEADAAMQQMEGGNRWLLDAVRVAVGSGLRLGELAALRWGAVDFDAGVLHVRNTDDFTTKSGRKRPVPIVGEAAPVLERLHAEACASSRSGKPGARTPVLRGATGKALAGDYASRRFRHYRRLSGLPEALRFHSLRHTFASWWVQRGGDLYRLKEIMGHADLKTTMKYAHLRPESLVDEARRIFPPIAVSAGVQEPQGGPHMGHQSRQEVA
ncbi:MAG: site-specific integrase [Bacteroidota bacterium]